MARLVTLNEFLQQSQTDVLNLKTEKLPEENTEKIETNTSEIRRKNREKLVQTKQNIRSPQITKDFDLDESILNIKIHNLDNMNINEFMEILNCNEKSDDSKKNKLNEGMLWHIRCDNLRFISPRTIIVLALRALFPEFTSEFD